jgi:DNA-binding NarL/FixJ family response regulator
MDGVTLLKTIKNEVSTSPVCIVLSNQGEKADIEAVEQLGVDGYIIKANMIPSEVVRTVGDIFDKKHK